MSGLASALSLRQAGLKVQLLEKNDAVGGRVRTDELEGFRLDRGFQVLLTAYPTCQSLLNYEDLCLGCFDPGAIIQLPTGRRTRVSDPFRQPLRALTTATAPIGTARDKYLILRLRACLRKNPPPRTPEWTSVTTEDWLKSFGFSPKIIERFFRPFFAGIFLDHSLETAAWMLGYTYHYFTSGYAALPRGGMQPIPNQLAEKVGADAIRTGAPVNTVHAEGVTLADGTRLRARAVIVAVDGDTARRWFPQLPPRAWQTAGSFFFDAPTSPLRGTRSLWLNGSGQGRINQIAVPSDIASDFAPPGRSLIHVGVVGPHAANEDAEAIQAEARSYFGDGVWEWRFLRSYQIPQALPASTPEEMNRLKESPSRIDGIYLCGDHCSIGSIEAALAGGVETAHVVKNSLA